MPCARPLSVLVRIPLAALLAALVAVSCAAQAPPAASAAPFRGTRALDDVRKLVAIGPRVAGMPGAAAARDYISTQLKAAGLATRCFPPRRDCTMTDSHSG